MEPSKDRAERVKRALDGLKPLDDGTRVRDALSDPCDGFFQLAVKVSARPGESSCLASPSMTS